MPVKIRLGLEIERENVPYHRVNHAVTMTTTVRRAVQANRHRRFVGTVPNCQCDHCDTIRANRLVARGEIPGHALDTRPAGWPEPPKGWTVKSDGSLTNGAEFCTKSRIVWTPGESIPALWEAAATVQSHGEAHDRAGTHVHVSIPGLGATQYREIGNVVFAKWRPRLWNIVNERDPNRTRRHSQFCRPSRDFIREYGRIPNRYDGYYDVVWSEKFNTFEFRLFPSFMSHTEVWAAIEPMLTDLAATVAESHPELV